MQIKCIHCENGIRKNPNLGYAHVLPSGEVVDCPFETREYRAQKLQHLTQRTLDGFPPSHRDEPFCECSVCMGFVSRSPRRK